MSFDAASLGRALAAHPRVARVVVAGVEGSAPREVGAAMLVWPGGQTGTIGGGALEYEAARAARAMLAGGPARRLERRALGPALGQCCGGAVRLLTEVFEAVPEGTVFARPVAGPAEPPLAVRRVLAQARGGGQAPRPQLTQGWMIEPISPPARPLWIHGAGHVGRALVRTLAPLPDVAITWVDSSSGRFPEEIPEGVTQLIAANPADLVPHAPRGAEHLILTYSHALDLELCHRLLGHGFARAGLIGSATKWARFRKRLRQFGHSDAQISRIRCPIGQPTLGKHPQAIAVGVAAELLNPSTATQAAKDAAR
ncbi:xanthine dehydrogenase accessory protein XdhC [Actibacterium sp. MT2.3-13A]|uniref:xanthine dehydrogenase accessory protein XdhC n=1 Tax=Actibacterium sp. MT2.3-13A TaxID=2828332 RepID=UPI001BAC9033|nr:xanthine dehydrogenase accessory protein XdhC [Actibacterium sp. MT2.3-13A]